MPQYVNVNIKMAINKHNTYPVPCNTSQKHTLLNLIHLSPCVVFFRVQVWANIFADQVTALAAKYSGAPLLQKVNTLAYGISRCLNQIHYKVTDETR